MPHHRAPHDRGDLLLTIEVDMPSQSPKPDVMAQLEKLIGGRRVVPPIDEENDEVEVEECELVSFDGERHRQRKEARDARKAADATHDDDEHRRGGPGGGVQCASQ